MTHPCARAADALRDCECVLAAEHRPPSRAPTGGHEVFAVVDSKTVPPGVLAILADAGLQLHPRAAGPRVSFVATP